MWRWRLVVFEISSMRCLSVGVSSSLWVWVLFMWFWSVWGWMVVWRICVVVCSVVCDMVFICYLGVLVVFVEVLSMVIYVCRYFMLFIKLLVWFCVVVLVGFIFVCFYYFS